MGRSPLGQRGESPCDAWSVMRGRRHVVWVKPRGFTLDGGEAWEQAVEHGHIRCDVRPTPLKGLFALSIRSVPFWKPDRPAPHRVTLPELDKEVVKWVEAFGSGRITAKFRASGDPRVLITI